jgi:hypothetical protein
MMELLNWIDNHGWTALVIGLFISAGVSYICDTIITTVKVWRNKE